MFELAKAAGWLVSPLTLVLLLGAAALALAAARRRRSAFAAGALAFGLLWVASMPATAIALGSFLENRHPAQTIEATPKADAIVVLGGALSGAAPPRRPRYVMSGAAGRIFHAAALYHAGKAPLIIVAAGNQPHETAIQTEAEAIAEMLGELRVPAAAIRLEPASRNTRENAANALEHARAARARTVLLVTSAIHMDRALRTFRNAWAGQGITVLPATTDFRIVGTGEASGMWFPTASSLTFVTNTVREFAGSLVIGIM